jgi:hypothetical protein
MLLYHTPIGYCQAENCEILNHFIEVRPINSGADYCTLRLTVPVAEVVPEAPVTVMM